MGNPCPIPMKLTNSLKKQEKPHIYDKLYLMITNINLQSSFLSHYGPIERLKIITEKETI